jgi:hypothetical protein
MFLVLTFENRREKILGMHIFNMHQLHINMHQLFLFSVLFNNVSQVNALFASDLGTCKNDPIYSIHFVCPYEVCYGQEYFFKECLQLG